jgi:hypothetical protein
VDDDRATLRAWAGTGPIAEIELDDEDRIVSADPDGWFLDVPVRLGGRTYDQIPMLLTSFYGRRTEAVAGVVTPSFEDRQATFESMDGSVEVRSLTRRVTGPEARVRICFASRPGVSRVSVAAPRRSA